MDKRIYTLSVLVAGAILTITGVTIFLNLMPAPSDKFTEFYLLNKDGKAPAYPCDIDDGQTLELIAGIINHQYKDCSYEVQVLQQDAIIKTIYAGTIPDKGKWEGLITLNPSEYRIGIKLEFFLFMDNNTEPQIDKPLVLITFKKT